MADESKNQGQDPSEEGGGHAKNGQAKGDQVPETWDEVFQHKRFKDLNTRAKTAEEQVKTLQSQVEGLGKKIQAKEDAGKTEVEKLTEQVGTLTQNWEQAQARALRLEVAQKQGIPVELVDRLQGSTAEELEADAERMKAFLKPSEGPGAAVLTKGGSAATFSLEGKTPEEIREAFAKGKIRL